MDQTNGGIPGASRQGRRIIQRQRRSSGVIEDPTQEFFRRHSKEYEALERHAYALSSLQTALRYAPSEFRGDTSSDEAFNPLNFGLRRR